ncbi:MAG TPA: DUF4124 domain-containing protein [Burkholderiales bacterium]|nr:DUF4124 domain-containing protein [Burkholderiales bacterium]
MGVSRALIFGVLSVSGAALAPPAHAQRTEIFKCVDATGRASYTNDRRETAGKQCEVVTTQINVAPPPKPAARSSFPRESAAERMSAAGRQRDILEKELAAEEQDLARARQALAEQEAVRFGDERNYAKVLERLQPFKDRIETHEKNIEALRRELSSLGR